MEFIVWTGDGAEVFEGDATYRLLDNGCLVVHEQDKQTTFSATGWLKLQEEPRRSAYAAPAVGVVVTDDTPSAAQRGF